MLVVKEFIIHPEDKPGTLGKLCRALADENVNILAFQAFPAKKGHSEVHLVLDNPTVGKAILGRQHVDYTETEVVQVKLPHRPGELARAASRLGEAKININYGYCGTENYGYTGIEAETNMPILIFGVADVDKAAKVFAQAMVAGASN